MMQFYVGGQDCQAKAHAVANALIKRIENELVRREMGEFTRKEKGIELVALQVFNLATIH